MESVHICFGEVRVYSQCIARYLKKLFLFHLPLLIFTFLAAVPQVSFSFSTLNSNLKFFQLLSLPTLSFSSLLFFSPANSSPLQCKSPAFPSTALSLSTIAQSAFYGWAAKLAKAELCFEGRVAGRLMGKEGILFNYRGREREQECSHVSHFCPCQRQHGSKYQTCWEVGEEESNWLQSNNMWFWKQPVIYVLLLCLTEAAQLFLRWPWVNVSAETDTGATRKSLGLTDFISK